MKKNSKGVNRSGDEGKETGRGGILGRDF